MSRSRVPRTSLVLVFLLVLGLSAATAHGRNNRRVVAVGDIHGAYDGLTTILREAGLIDNDNRWIGGKAILVQTGDFTDRGGDVLKVMDLLMRLQQEAKKARGQVIVLLGNHEMWTVMRNDRDIAINPEIYSSFSTADSELLREKAWRERQSWSSRRATERGEEPIETSEEEKEDWYKRHPPGFFEYHQAMSADGKYGRWIRERPVVHKIGDTVFLHGGISEDYSVLPLSEINALYRREIAGFDRARRSLEETGIVLPFFTWEETVQALNDELERQGNGRVAASTRESAERIGQFFSLTGREDSPLWFRGYAQAPYGLTDESLETLRQKLTSAYGAKHFVSAHSPFNGGDILMRLGGAFFLIDTGMLSSFYVGGRPSALEISGDRFSAIYEGARQPLLPIAETEAFSPAILRRSRPSRIRLAATTAQEDQEPETRPPYVWRTPDGAPLPFDSHEELLDFLRDARVISREPVGEGRTGAERLMLEEGGVTARAIFHTIRVENRVKAPKQLRLADGTNVSFFRDSYSGQAAAYELSRLLDLNNVPPTVVREVQGADGSVALWIENGTNLTKWQEEHGHQPKNELYTKQFHDMRVFDALINNIDRNTGNIFWTRDWNLWLIDHTRAFGRNPNINRPERILRCSRQLLQAIHDLDENEVSLRLKPYLSIFEIRALLKRRTKLIKHLERRIKTVGERSVLFDYDKPLGQLVAIRAAPEKPRHLLARTFLPCYYPCQPDRTRLEL